MSGKGVGVVVVVDAAEEVGGMMKGRRVAIRQLRSNTLHPGENRARRRAAACPH